MQEKEKMRPQVSNFRNCRRAPLFCTEKRERKKGEFDLGYK